MLARAIAVHAEWLAGLEALMRGEVGDDQVLWAADCDACGLGKLLGREDFQSRLSQHRFSEIFCEHMYFHEKAGQLVDALAVNGPGPAADILSEEVRRSSQKLVRYLSEARS